MYIRKIVLSIVILLFVIAFSNTAKAQVPSISAKASPKTLSAGDKSVLTITFKTSSGIKISKEPEIEVTLTGEDVEGVKLQDYSGYPGGDYLDGKQIKYNFKVSSDATAGTKTLTVKVKFAYCSSESGVCKITTKTTTTKIKVQ
jgi:hypothetical protein